MAVVLLASLVLAGQLAASGGPSDAPQDPIDTTRAEGGYDQAPSAVGGVPGALSLPHETHDLAYDPITDRIWLASMSIGEPDWLVSVDARTGDSRAWPLPETDHNGYLMQVKLGGSGDVWVTQPYAIVRFDPATERMQSLSFDIETDGALADALDPGNPLPGTWISSLGFDGDQLLVGRNNAPFLLRLDGELKSVGRVDIPAKLAGPRDVLVEGDRVYILSGHVGDGELAVLDRTGTLIGLSAVVGSRLELLGGQVAVTGTAGGAALIDSRGGEAARASSELGIGQAAFDPRGGVTVYSRRSHSIGHFVDGVLVSKVVLPLRDVEIFAPSGGTVSARVPPEVADLVTDVRGTTWYAIRNVASLSTVQLE